MIEVETPDGGIAEFPEDTPKEDITRAMRKRFGVSDLQKARENVPEGLQGPLRRGSGVFAGLTAGLDDEMSGLVAGAQSMITGGDFWPEYERGRDLARDMETIREAEAPWMEGASKMIGSMLLPGGAMKRGAGMVANAARSAGGGAAIGALTGFGEGEGAEQRARGAKVGGAIGAGAGLAIPAAGGVAGAIGKRAYAPFRARSKRGSKEVAAEKTGAAMREGGVEPSQAAQKMRDMQREGAPAMAVDTGGEATRGLLRTTGNLSKSARSKINEGLTDRASDATNRIRRIIARTVADPDGYGDAVDKIVRARTRPDAPATTSDGQQTTIGDLWNKARQTPIQPSEKLADLAERPAMQRGIKKAREMAANKGEDFDPTKLQTWHTIKRGLDRIIREDQTAISPFGATKLDDSGKAIDAVRRELLAELDVQNSFYKEARRASMDTFQRDEALEFGKKAIVMTPEQVRRKMREFNPGQKELAKVGYAEALRKKIDATGDFGSKQDPVKRVFNSKGQRDVADAILEGNKTDYDALYRAMEGEKAMRQSYEAATGNSTTAQQLADMQDAQGMTEGTEIAASAASGNLLGATYQGILKLMKKAGNFPPQAADEVQRLLMESDPKQVEQMAALLSRLEADKSIDSERAKRLVTTIVRGLSSTGGRMAQGDQ